MKDLQDKVAVITGGAGGVGSALAVRLADRGCHLALVDISEEALTKVVNELSVENINITSHVVDITDKAQMSELPAKVLAAHGKVNILVNNAGINVPRLLVDPAGKEELTEEIWDQVFAVNVKGQSLCAQAAARAMLASGKGGVLINMTSESGMEGSEGQSVYAATKAANHNTTRSWAKELGRQGVRVVGVGPGIMETTSMRSPAYEESLAYTRGISAEELREKYGSTSSIPLGRSGKLSEVADLVVFLASERASYIHGTTVNISGGKSRG